MILLWRKAGGEVDSLPRFVADEGAGLGAAPGADTVIGLAIFVSVIGLGYLCWGLFDLMAYALPAIVGIAAGVAAYHTGAGVFGGIAVAFATGALTLAAGQVAVETSRSVAIRRTVALLFAIPAGWLGYGIALNLAQLGGASSAIWQQVLALSGAVVVGTTAWMRVTTRVRQAPGRR